MAVMLKTGLVHVTARGSDVAFVIDEEATFDVVADELREYLAKQNGLWSKGNITVNVGRRMLAQDELGQMRSIIETHSGLKVTRFWCSPDTLGSGDFQFETAAAPAIDQPSNNHGSNGHGDIPKTLIHNEVALSGPSPKILDDASSVESVIEELKSRQNKNGARNRNRTEALFIKSTFHSGESVDHPGDVVVLADVNPGAEIRAEGDIVVLGALNGLAHAGSSGDTKAVIIALELRSNRIQIAKYQGIAPASNGRKSKSSTTGPKVAYVRSRSIRVAPFAGRFARYSKGVPYDG